MNTRMRNTCRSYSELIKIKDFYDRFDYLKLDGRVGDMTFGGNRMLNQILYQSPRWKSTRREIILRDNGCDLAHEEYSIPGAVYIHHINPITVDDILQDHESVFDPDNLICVSFKTHNAIHYGNDNLVPRGITERKRNDTCLWR